MQQFVVPQFIDVEDKIFGPITIRQFLIMLGGGTTIFLAFRYADFALFLTTLIVVGSLSLLFAFYKPNGQHFHFFILNIGQTLRKPGLRIWYKGYSKKDLEYFRTRTGIEEVEEIEERKVVKQGHIRDLSLTVNTGGYYRAEEE